jgi:MYXO-CTERM domain-containing protein
MEYALPNFKLEATAADATIKATRQTQKVSGTLLPGEKARFTLAISGGAVASIADLDFSVSFGNGQSGQYGEGVASGAKAVMIRKNDGTLIPSGTPPGIGKGNEQAAQLYSAALADFGNTNTGLDKLLKLYCAGRASWDSGSAGVIVSNCPDATTTVCPTSKPGSGTGSKFDYIHLWAAGELAARKSGLGARTSVLRARLQCGVNDANNGFAGFALMMLGYLGEDSGARAFIEGKIAAAGDLGTIAKAALLLMGNAADLAKYQADVTAGTSTGSVFVKAACAAALGIVAKDDATVSGKLIPLAKWIEPDTEDNGQAIYAAQLLNLVAWDRRGWAPGAGDTGAVSFYGESPSPAGGGGGSPGLGGMTGTGEGGATSEGGAASQPGGGSGGCSVTAGTEGGAAALLAASVAALLGARRRRRRPLGPR